MPVNLQNPDPHELLVAIAAMHIMLIGLAHIVGGSAWSNRVARGMWRFYRRIASLPFQLIAWAATNIARLIRGGGGGNNNRGH